MNTRFWTHEEDQIVRRGYKKGLYAKTIAKQLVDRSHRAVICRAERLGLNGKWAGVQACTYSWIADLVNAELANDVPMTLRQIATKINRSMWSVRHAVRNGHGTKYYIADYVKCGTYDTPRYALGKEPDAAKPIAKTKRELHRIYRQRKQNKVEFNPFAVAMNQVMHREAA